jgi:hypothetical protein
MGSRDGEMASVQRMLVSESAANTFTHEKIQSKAVSEMNLIMLIWKIEYLFDNIDLIADGDYVTTQITRDQQSSVLAHDSTNLVHEVKIDNNFVTSGMQETVTPIPYTFDPPLPFALDNFHLSCLSAGQAAAVGHGVNIYYTLREVKDKNVNKMLIQRN